MGNSKTTEQTPLSSTGYHPNIGSIIRVRDQIFTALYVEDNIISFLKQSKGLMFMLKPADRSKELRDSFDDELTFFAVNKSRTRKISHLNSYRKKYDDWFMDINKILWEKNYLENETYGMRYPSEMSKDQAYKSPLL